MPQTVLITGASTGIGRAAAELFLERGWNVIATMRSKDKAGEFAHHERCLVTELDVNREDTIAAAIADGMKQFGKIDVLVNNAGYALTGPFETMTDEQVRTQFETNVLGLMRVTRHMLPHMRAAGGGTIVNIASMGGRVTFPLYSVYHGTKFAVEGFTESLQFELSPQNIRVKLIEPGAIKTDFYSRSMKHSGDNGISQYADFIETVMPTLQAAGETGTDPRKVAERIFAAATDTSNRLRFYIGKNAALLLILRRFFPDSVYARAIRLFFTLKK